MKKRTIKLSFLLAILVGIFTACSNEEWDKHYNNTDVVLINQSLSEIIETQTDITIFNRLLEISGYDQLLSTSQTFTVWAPLDTDSAWMADFGSYSTSDVVLSSNDSLKIKKVIGSHISRFSYPTSGLDSQRLYLLCNKIADFKMINSNAYFGKSRLGSSIEVPAKNGLLHKIAGYNPYIPSQWEYITTYPEVTNMDSLKAYLASLVVVDEYDNKVNYVFNDYAKLDNDDSTYTFLALSNVAWANALTTALPYFKVYQDAKGLQYEHSKKAIFSNLFFSRVSNPIGRDSIISTTKTVFKNADYLFAGATKMTLSNGSIFFTDSLRMKPISSYHKTIKVEAETNTYGRSNANSDLYLRSYTGSTYDISGDKYAFMKFNGSANSQKASISLNMPNVLSAKYKLYVVFVPEIVENTYDPKPVKAEVRVIFRAATGRINPPNIPNVKVSNILVSATEVQKIFIKDIQFPWCSMYEKGNPNSLDVKVTVENTVTTTEQSNKTHTRDLRVDCVILEPVE